jgi:hypothetical protein
MTTKLSRMLSSSSSLKYSTSTCTNRCRKITTCAAFVFCRESASTACARARQPCARAPRAGRGKVGRTVEVRVPDVDVVDALAREARRELLALLLDVEHDRHEALDARPRHVVPVRALDQRLALQVCVGVSVRLRHEVEHGAPRIAMRLAMAERAVEVEGGGTKVGVEVKGA